MRIRPTKHDDIPDLTRVVDETDLFPSEMLPDLWAAGGALWLTCETDDRAIGFCYARPEEMADAVWNMLAIAVLPGMQGQSFGSELVAALEARLREDGQRLLIVDTSGLPAFARTRAFYARLGYAEEARIRDFWAAGDDKVTFCKRL